MDEEKELLEEQDQAELVQSELLEVIRSGLTRSALRERLEDFHDADIAQLLEELSSEERVLLYRALDTERISDIFSYLDDVEDYFHELGLEKSADVLEEMDADDAVDVLETLPDEYREQLVERMDEEAQEDIALITSYEDDEIGSMMTTNYIVIRKGCSVKQAMKELISQAEDNDNITTIYVENEDGTFYGALELKKLILARKETDLDSVTITSYPYVQAHAKISEEIERLRSYSEDSIPVLDEDDKLIGVITAFDVVEAVDDEISEDYAKLAGMTDAADLKESLLESIRKRLPWLCVLLGLGLIVSTVVGVFESVVQQIALVVCFQSVILDMSGNTGTQSLAVTIRVLMDEELTGKQKRKFIFKEARVGATNGLILGISSFILVGLYIMLLKHQTFLYSFAISGCVGLSLCIAMVITSLVGTLVPMIFHKLKVDPAVASGPLITTTSDLVAVVTYYGLVWVLLLNVLHLAG